MIHVHGALGGLAPAETGGRGYSPTLEPAEIRAAADEIVIVSEVVEDAEEFAAAAKILEIAERIEFLGFGFHRPSVRRLAVFNELWTDERRQKVRVGGTCRMIPGDRWVDICENVLNGAIPPGYGCADTVFNGECTQSGVSTCRCFE